MYVPCPVRPVYLAKCHEGHQGIEKTRARARQFIYWPGLSVEIGTFVDNCNVCIKFSSVRHEPVVEFPLPGGPWEELACDLFEFYGKHYLIVVDYYPRWIEAVPVTSQTSKAVVTVLKDLFTRYGTPKGLRSDNGPCFASETFQTFCGDPRWNFNFRTSSPRYPQSNGLAERAVRTVKSLWSKDPDREGALLAYRDTPLQFGFSPDELMIGWQIGTSLGIRPRLPVDFEAFERTAIKQAYDRRMKWNRKYLAKPLSELIPGQKVLMKAPNDVGCEGIVLKYDTSPNSVLVQCQDRTYRRNRKHLFPLSPVTNVNPASITEYDPCDAVSSEYNADYGNNALLPYYVN